VNVSDPPRERILHLLIDAHGCAGPLDDADALLAVMREAAAAVGAKEQGNGQARYVPHGVTAILFLAESHILVSTWPERNLALVEVLLCNEQMDPAAAWAVLERALRPTGPVTQQTVWRGID
jgi:S-adenosylmethionine decarboxylase